ncbi:DUF488 domain-containing protein [bacterium]|nr:MAG: DUF488 domain-containing protein [bacterium]
MKLFTIGFTKKSAETFFMRLTAAGVKHLVDVRLKNVSQLAGFTRRDDLRYFAGVICGIDYVHLPDLAPTDEMLTAQRKTNGDWGAYEKQFLRLMRSRRIEETAIREVLDGSCLLCSEESPHHCHRRLVAEYLKEKWGNVEIEHIP